MAQMVKNLPAMWETWVTAFSGRSPGEGNGYPLQYFNLENSTDRGDEQTTNQEKLSQKSFNIHKLKCVDWFPSAGP